MAQREDVEILRHDRHETILRGAVAAADREDMVVLQRIAQVWLAAEHWDPELWWQFAAQCGSRKVQAA